jgi:mannose-6-phosphate isomerase-like protein (cupin superfamily)
MGAGAMERKKRYRLALQDGRDEPIKDLEGAARIILVDRDTVGAEDITFGYLRWESKTSFHKKHTHEDAEEIIYVLSGKAMGGVGQEEFEIKKGDTLWVPRGMVHWAYNPFDEPSEMLLVYSRPTLKTAGYEILE